MKAEIYSMHDRPGKTHAVMTAPEAPDLKDFDLTNVPIDRVANGVVVECRYKMKPEAQAKKQKGKDYIDYDSRYPNDKHAFNDMDEAAAFITGRLLGKSAEKKKA